MTVRVLRALACAPFLWLAWWETAAGLPVSVERDDATRERGTLVAIDAASATIAGQDGRPQSIPVEHVRVVERDGPPAPVAPRVRVTLLDGTTLDGDDFATTGPTARLVLPGGLAELPLARVWAVEWLGEAADQPQSWSDAIPEGVTSDLVVVRKAGTVEFVECAIKEVGAEAVTVVLEDETIPVKRSKVVGLRWLRATAAPTAGRTAVQVAGGTLRADTVAWTPAGLVLDADDAERRVSLPSESLERIDYAAGRTTHLATLAPERLDVEPFFGPLGSIEGFAAYFAPRPVPADGRFAKPGLAMRPRTVAVWRIPPRSRRFRTSVAVPAGASATVVAIAVDERPVFEQTVSGADPVPVEIDVVDGRRLAITVDFPPAGGVASAVRFAEPVIEQ